MLSWPPFYHGHFKRYITVFGTLFNDISIVRKGQNGKEKTVKVPLSFVQRDKVLERFRQNPTLKEAWNNSFPRMTFELGGSPVYNGQRKENSVNYQMKNLGNGKASMQFTPAPYDINMVLSVFSNYFEDGLQVVEQILPFFQPEYTIRAKEIPELDIDRDIHIVLNSVTMNDNVEGSFEEGRLIEWSLDFTVKGFFFGPLQTDKNLITRVDANTIFKWPKDGPEDFDVKVHLEGNPVTREITSQIIEK